MEKTRITIFDTTLRDGEQSPGCSMNVPEKLRLAHQLDRLGVDVIEAGFPADYCGSRPRHPAGHRARLAGTERRRLSANPCLFGHLRYSSAVQVAHDAPAVPGAGS